MRFILLSFMLLGLSYNSLACSCAVPEHINFQEYNEYDFIFEGIYTGNMGIDSTSTQWTFEWEIERLYKGKKTNQTVITYALISCEYFPKEGEKWLVYANERNGKHYSSICTRSKSFSPEDSLKKAILLDDIDFLENILLDPNGYRSHSGIYNSYRDGSIANLKSEGSLINGVANGAWVYEYSWGLKTIVNYKMGVLHGDYIQYLNDIKNVHLRYENGELVAKE